MARFSRTRAIVLVASAASLIGAAACGLLVPIERAARPAEAGASDADASEAPDVVIDPCVALPEPPTEATHDPDLPAIRFAAYEWDFRAGDSGITCQTPGHNLDGVYTGGQGCRDNAACKPRFEPPLVTACDQAGGVDNALEKLFKLVEDAPIRPDASFEPSVSISRGIATLLLELKGYSGKPNDEQVIVNFYGASRMIGVDVGDASTLTILELERLKQVWDGGQDAEWALADETAVQEGPLVTPRFSPSTGYVRDNILVLPELAEGILGLTFDGRGLRYESGRFSARIVNEGGKYGLTHARLGVSVRSGDFIGLAAGIEGLVVTEGAMCEPANKDVYEGLFRTPVCSGLDLLSNAKVIDAAAECDYLSVGSTFAFAQTRFAPIVEKRPRREPCPDYDAGTVWCDDCTWPQAKRCPIDTGDAGDAAGD